MRKDAVIAAAEMKEHTAEAIAGIIESQLQKYNLKSKKIVGMVRDDAANMKKTSGILSLDRQYY